MSGLDFVRAMIAGEFAHPSMADTIPMRATEAERGRLAFTVRVDERHLNPLGGVHGGFAATVLDSVTGCAVHTGVSEGSIKDAEGTLFAHATATCAILRR